MIEYHYGVAKFLGQTPEVYVWEDDGKTVIINLEEDQRLDLRLEEAKKLYDILKNVFES